MNACLLRDDVVDGVVNSVEVFQRLLVNQPDSSSMIGASRFLISPDAFRACWRAQTVAVENSSAALSVCARSSAARWWEIVTSAVISEPKPHLQSQPAPQPTWGSQQEVAVVEFALVRKHVRVGVSGNGEVALADVLADPRPRHPAEVQQRTRRWRRSCGLNAGTPAAVQARVIAVRNLSPPNPWKTGRSGCGRRGARARAQRRTATGARNPTRPAVFDTASDTRQRDRGSSTSPQVRPRARRAASRSRPG